MPTTPETLALHRALSDLQRCVGALRSRYGGSPSVLRVANDVERLAIDAAELDGLIAPVRSPVGEVVIVPDTPYDSSLWHGADDEGVGGYRQR